MKTLYQQHIVDTIEKSVFWKPSFKNLFRSMMTIGEDQRRRKKSSQRGYDRIVQADKSFFDNEYLPKTRTTIGVSNFPNGLAYYKERVHHYTTTNMSYEEVYQLGLKEVERIKKLMQDAVKEANFPGTIQEFITYLRTDPKFYATTPEQLLKEASYIAKQMMVSCRCFLVSFHGNLTV